MQLEKGIQTAILNYLSILENQGKPIYAFRTQSGAVPIQRGNKAGYFKTGRKGAPDITVCYGGRFIALEVKTEKGKLSEAQTEAAIAIKKAGGEYYIVRSVEDLTEILGNL